MRGVTIAVQLQTKCQARFARAALCGDGLSVPDTFTLSCSGKPRLCHTIHQARVCTAAGQRE
jgi:hypothetical protein